MLNISSLLYSTVESPTFMERLEVAPYLDVLIKDARTTIRSWLRGELPKALRADGYADVAVAPRFFTQGSVSYGTVNSPAHVGQQIDIDDGLYLPLEFMKATAAPSRASAIFFAATENALAPLVLERGWKMDRTKDLCIRIEIHPQAHVDMPLYAIPQDQFVLLKRAFDERATRALRVDANDEEDEDLWAHVPENQVLIAHRTYGWKKSDPRPLKVWFENAVARHGEQLRRIVRDVKGYRDYAWIEGGPASLLLMAATVQIFEAKSRRDDLSLLHVLERLPATLRAGVRHPVDGTESLTDRLGEGGVEEAAQKMECLAQCLHQALTNDTPQSACRALVEQLGARFPNEPHRVQVVPAPSGRIEHVRPSNRPEAGPGGDPTAARVSAAASALRSVPKPWGCR